MYLLVLVILLLVSIIQHPTCLYRSIRTMVTPSNELEQMIGEPMSELDISDDAYAPIAIPIPMSTPPPVEVVPPPHRDLNAYASEMSAYVEQLEREVGELQEIELKMMIEENKVCKAMFSRVFHVLVTEQVKRMNQDPEYLMCADPVLGGQHTEEI